MKMRPLSTGLTFLLIVFSLPLFGQDIFRMDQPTVNTCDGILFDSGGNQFYGPNEDLVTTVCPDGSGETHVQISFSGVLLGCGDSIFVYDGPDTSSPLITQAGRILANDCESVNERAQQFIVQATAQNISGCITIRFRSDAIFQEAGFQSRITCVSRCQPVVASLQSASPSVVPIDTGYIDACPGQLVTLSGAGAYPQNNLFYAQSDANSTFEWDFGDGNSATGPDVTHAYTRSGGYVIQLKITDQMGCSNTNFITQRVRISTKPEFSFTGDFGNPVCTKDTIEANLSSLAPVEGTFFSGQVLADTLALPDGDGTSYETSLEFTQFAPGQTLVDSTDIQNISVNMEHTWVRDLEIELVCPSGKSIVLHNFFAEEGTGIFLGEPIDFDGIDPTPGVGYDYAWTPNAQNDTWLNYIDANLVNGQTLPSGQYTPYESFGNLIGCPLNGEWRIRVTDKWQWDNGFIFSWGIGFNPDLFPVVETYTPEIQNYGFETIFTPFEQTNDIVKTVAQAAGTSEFIFQTTDNFGCTFDTTLTVDVLPPSHPNCVNCDEGVITMADTVICDGASVQLLAGSQSLPESIIFDFAETVRRNFDKISLPRNTELIHTIDVTDVSPNQINSAQTDIVSICVDLEIDGSTPYSIEVESPTGQRMVLVQQGIVGDFQNVCFQPDATQTLVSVAPPFVGTFVPTGDWSDLDGSNMNGSWKLIVFSLAGDVIAGSVNSWSISFQGSNPTTYQWSPAEGLSCVDCPDPIATPQTNTTYTVEVSNSFGCVYTDEVQINVDPSLNTMMVDNVNIDPVSCFNTNTGSAEVVISGGNAPFNFIWSDSLAQISARAVNLFAGQYQVTVTDDIGCVRVVDATVTQPDTLIVDFMASDVLCREEATGQLTATPIGGTSPYNFSWSNGSTNGLNDALLAGTYSVTVTDDNGCISIDEASLIEPATLVEASIVQLQEGCFGQSDNELEVLPSGGTGTNYSFSWSDGQSQSIATGLDTINYVVTVSDENGCTTTANFTPTDLEAIAFNIIQSRPTCYGDTDGQLAVNNLSGGVGATPTDYSIAWTDPVSNAAIGTGEIVDGLAGGQLYRVRVTDVLGCFTELERELEQPDSVSFVITPTSISCFGLEDGMATIDNLRGEGSNFVFQWDGAANNQTAASANNLAAGIYRVTVSDERGCSSLGMVRVEQPAPINLSFAKEDNPCFGDLEGLIVTTIQGGVPDFSYIWSNGATTKDQENLRAGTYSLTVTDNNGCESENQIEITEPTPVNVSLQGIDPLCFGDENGQIIVTAEGGSGPYTYSLDGEIFSASNRLLGLGEDTYNVYVADINDCVLMEEMSLQAPPEFNVFVTTTPSFDEEITIMLGDSIDLTVNPVNAQGSVNYAWIAPYEGTLNCDSCQTVSARPGNTIFYQLRATDDVGCQANELVNVYVQKIRAIEVPTGFTPNNDANNDKLLVHGRPGTTINVFRIFDRWGQLLYEAGDFAINSEEKGWDGTFRGLPVDPDTYIWYLEAQFIDGSTEIYRGQTNLIR